VFSRPVHCSGEKTRDDGGEDLRSGTPGGSSGGALNQVIGVLVVIVLVLPTLVLGQRFFFGPSAGKESPQDQHQSKQEAPKDRQPKEVQHDQPGAEPQDQRPSEEQTPQN
jgi:predicted metalloprotease